ncbi:RNA polymerase sigma factor [Nocardioides humi]|uniref:RNA polymerase sigma factor n=1 Tax=Nocardioides humi TaxID=449461 RepID=A0ABN1ZW65_9ACTN|nr:RNA polymerase sigma factor [Nocardioides humi]
MQHYSDVELLALVGRGEEAALRELVERHSGWLLLRLRRRSPDEELAHDALHDTFVAVWRNPGSFRGEGDLGAWLWGIAIRQLISRLRKKAPPVPASSEVIAARSPLVASAEDELLVAVAHGGVGDALKALSPELVRVLQATVIDGLTTKEAAQLLGIPQGTVKSRARIAKARLREQLVLQEGW